MATKTSGLKLVHKGLILSSIPLAFGIVFILAFESVMLDLRHYRNENDRAVSIASHLNNIQLSLFAEQGRYLDAVAGIQQTPVSTGAGIIMMGEIAAIRKTLIAHPNTLLQLSQIDGIAQQIQLVQRSNNSAQQGSDLPLASAQTRSALDKLESKLSELKQIVLDSAIRNKALAKASDQSAQIFTALAITCCIAVCPTFALYFTQNLVRRLSVLAENSDRFGRGESLIDTKGGADEIG